MLELLKSTDQSKDERDRLMEGLETSIHDVLYVLDTLLHWGKMQFMGLTVRPVRFDVYPLVVDTLRLLRLSAQLKEIEIINQVPQEVFIYADQEQFKFVIRNLLSNAIKYSPRRGKVILAVNPHQNNEVVFSVRDYGVGMDPQEMQAVFDLDRRSTPGTANETGHGIALSLSREFITQNSGKIWVESEKGKGSTFYFSLAAGGPSA